jgi:large subunit ribosomal protein L28
MAKVCQVTGRKPSRGFKYVTRGIAKKKKGIGLKVTGKTKRVFNPNLLRKRFWFAKENRWVSLRLSAQAMRTVEKNGIEKVINELRQRGQKV